MECAAKKKSRFFALDRKPLLTSMVPDRLRCKGRVEVSGVRTPHTTTTAATLLIPKPAAGKINTGETVQP
jgi:hypothetical protein